MSLNFEQLVFADASQLSEAGSQMVKKAIIDGDSATLDDLASGIVELVFAKGLTNSQIGKIQSAFENAVNLGGANAWKPKFKSDLFILKSRQSDKGGGYLCTLGTAMIETLFESGQLVEARVANLETFFYAFFNYCTR